MSLTDYQRKRNFKKTPEPKPKVSRSKGALRFSIQLHAATRRHYDFRLELDGVMKSWAIPRGPSVNPNDQRLAVMVEDHPMDYRLFEGIIPKGNYGAGTVLVWDEGEYTSRANPDRKAGEEELRKGLAKGHLTFVLSGKKLRGEFALVKIKKGEPNAWLLVKKRDGFHSYKEQDLDDRSVLSGRTLDEITRGAKAKGEIWLPGKGRAEVSPAKVKKTTKKPAKKSPAVLEKLSAKILAQAPKEKFPEKLKPRSFPISRQEEAREKWIYEPEWDGYRALLSVNEGVVTISSRLSANLQRKFPQLAAACKKIPLNILLDGYVVLLDQNGKPRAKGQAASERAAAFYAIDLLHYNGVKTRSLPLDKRKTVLSSLLAAQKNLSVRANAFVKDAAEAESEFHDPAMKGILSREHSGNYDKGDGAVFHLIREMQVAPEREEKKSPKADSEVAGHTAAEPKQKGAIPRQVAFTNTKKIYWPDEGYSKGDLIAYYKAVAPFMLPHLKDRPQSLNRHPNGIEGKSFFQKEVTGQVPRWLATTHIESGSSGKAVNYALCQNESALLFLANMGCIEINVWNSRWQHIECPDYVVIDIDPGKIDFKKVLEVTLAARSFLDQMEAYSFCKTSGGRGMHIYVPLKPKYSHDDVREFALALSERIHQQLPATTSLERSPAKRTQLIYLDYLQNRRGQTMAAPYSARPRPHAPVSMPLRWSEVTAKLNPLDYTIKTAMRRLERWGDAWEKIYEQRNDLKHLKARLDSLRSPP